MVLIFFDTKIMKLFLIILISIWFLGLLVLSFTSFFKYFLINSSSLKGFGLFDAINACAIAFFTKSINAYGHCRLLTFNALYSISITYVTSESSYSKLILLSMQNDHIFFHVVSTLLVLALSCKLIIASWGHNLLLIV
jgi:hypothetical protein